MEKKTHRVMTFFDQAFLHDLEKAGEIKISKHGHVYGMAGFVQRLWKGRKK